MKQRKWLADEKLAIVMEGVKGIKSVTDICREHKVSQTQYYKWRDRFLEGGRSALAIGYGNGKQAAMASEVEQLQKLIGKQAIQIEILKKTKELFGTR